jgi:glycosyltransferase involved in cell wall biosynthesis
VEFDWKRCFDLVKPARVTIIIPAYREGEKIIPTLERLVESITLPFECLVIIDEIDDSTIKYVNEFSELNSNFRYIANDLGKGPALAIKKGFEIAKAHTAIVTMADGSDDPRLIDDLVRLIERGVVIAAASRYMPGGQQIGAPRIKSALSKFAGKTLFWFTGVGTHDATNSFKAYSVIFVRRVGIHSNQGFELGLELVAKANRLGEKIAQLPTIWIERESGKSNFKLFKWLPDYLAWYLFAFGRLQTLDELNRSSKKLMLTLSKLKRR